MSENPGEDQPVKRFTVDELQAAKAAALADLAKNKTVRLGLLAQQRKIAGQGDAELDHDFNTDEFAAKSFFDRAIKFVQHNPDSDIVGMLIKEANIRKQQLLGYRVQNWSAIQATQGTPQNEQLQITRQHLEGASAQDDCYWEILGKALGCTYILQANLKNGEAEFQEAVASRSGRNASGGNDR